MTNMEYNKEVMAALVEIEKTAIQFGGHFQADVAIAPELRAAIATVKIEFNVKRLHECISGLNGQVADNRQEQTRD